MSDHKTDSKKPRIPTGGARRAFPEEFKREAIRLAAERGNLSATARELGISDSVLQRWKQRQRLAQERPQSGPAFPGNGNARDEEVARLKRDNARLLEEVEILKKAVGIFTSRPQ